MNKAQHESQVKEAFMPYYSTTGIQVSNVTRNPMNLKFVREYNEVKFCKGKHSHMNNFTKGAFGGGSKFNKRNKS